ncbi:hypothetical protein T069G_03890 [Trichoderma breve]|uniref:Uncharacterized protein n=1 Tax=Trichoderma breve TaxID=2034170 RepID=A0A9W9BN66_9HYPO|nr:hypothetical protein T069G_03890 [Trichoderma breve]KAJ4862936.1 hypothetical protein T069G_03890 [Trichoderma breve]
MGKKKKAGVSEAGQTEADADAQALDSKQMRLHHDQGHGRDAGDQGRMAQTAPHGPSRADTSVGEGNIGGYCLSPAPSLPIDSINDLPPVPHPAAKPAGLRLIASPAASLRPTTSAMRSMQAGGGKGWAGLQMLI